MELGHGNEAVFTGRIRVELLINELLENIVFRAISKRFDEKIDSGQ